MDNKSNKGIMILLIVLILLVIGIGGVLVYDKLIDNKEKLGTSKIEEEKEEEKENVNEKQKEIYTYVDMEGEFEFISNKYTDSNGNDGSDEFVLSLSKNGIFHYRNSFYANSGVLGNYIIEDNKLRLNILFEHGSGTGVLVTEVTNKELEIKSKDELIDNENKSQTGKIYNKLTLKRNNTSKEEITNLLNNYFNEIKNNLE